MRLEPEDEERFESMKRQRGHGSTEAHNKSRLKRALKGTGTYTRKKRKR